MAKKKGGVKKLLIKEKQVFEYTDGDGKRFISKIDLIGECWLWNGCLTNGGYGQFSNKQKIRTAHRFSWYYHNGDIPDGMFVLHKCDIRNCVNPEHLFLGTAQDNSDDMVRKNRQGDTSGERNSMSKLTNEQVTEIREIYSKEKRWGLQTELGNRYGVSQHAISKIVNGKLRTKK